MFPQYIVIDSSLKSAETSVLTVLPGTFKKTDFETGKKAPSRFSAPIASPAGPGPTKPHQKKYEEMYEKKYGEKSVTMDKGGWDAVMVIADAIHRAGSLDPTAIRDALKRTKNFPGMKATLSFSESGQATSAMYAGQIRSGNTHIIKEIKIFDNPPFPVDRE